jgi:hypothetical protein
MSLQVLSFQLSPTKYVIVCWTRLGVTSIYTKEKKTSTWPWSSRSPIYIYIYIYIRPTLSTNMVQWVLRWERQKRCSRRKKQGPMAKKWCYNTFFGKENIKTREYKRIQENGQTWLIVFKTSLFSTYQKKSTHSLFGAWSFLLIHICFTPSEGPKNFINWFTLRNQTMGNNHLPRSMV